jgi:hypothetical protein
VNWLVKTISVKDKEESQMDEDVFGRKSENPLEIWKQTKNPKSHFALIKYLIHFSYQFVTFFSIVHRRFHQPLSFVS